MNNLLKVVLLILACNIVWLSVSLLLQARAVHFHAKPGLIPAVFLHSIVVGVRDVTNFVFAFDMRILNTFQPFDIRRIVGSISSECEYFILFNLIKLC